MRINVSGTVFDVPRKWIDKFPNSLFCRLSFYFVLSVWPVDLQSREIGKFGIGQ